MNVIGIEAIWLLSQIFGLTNNVHVFVLKKLKTNPSTGFSDN